MRKICNLLLLLALTITIASNINLINNTSIILKFNNKNQLTTNGKINPFDSNFNLADSKLATVAITGTDKNQTIYAASNYLYKSNNGVEFNKTTPKDLEDKVITNLAMTYNTNTLYATTEDALYYSNDQGTNFNKISTQGLPESQIKQLVVNPVNNVIYGVTSSGLYKSIDGKNFSCVIANDKIKTLAITTLGIIYYSDSDNNLYQTNNDDVSFKSVVWNKGPISALEIDNNNNLYLATDYGIYKHDTTANTLEKIKNTSDKKAIKCFIINNSGSIYYIDNNTALRATNLMEKLLDVNIPNYVTTDNEVKFYYNKYQWINIKTDFISAAQIDNITLTIPVSGLEMDKGKHILSITLKEQYKDIADLFGGSKGNVKIAYSFIIKLKADAQQITYRPLNNDTEVLTGLTSNAGNTKDSPIITSQPKSKTGNHFSAINITIDNDLFNMVKQNKSYYISGEIDNNNFNATGQKHFITTNSINILNDGIYYLHIVDLIGNEINAYLELGKNNWQLRGDFDDENLLNLANLLNVTIAVTSLQEKDLVSKWLKNYQDDANIVFNQMQLQYGAGFNLQVTSLKDNYKSFLDPIIYQTENNTKENINRNNLKLAILATVNQTIQTGLEITPKLFKVASFNVVNKQTLDKYLNWIKSYQIFILKNINIWIRNAAIIAGRGFATEQQILATYNDVIQNHDWNYFLKQITWTINITDNYSQFIDYQLLEDTSFATTKHLYPEVNQEYQSALIQSESGLNLHGYTTEQILNGEQLPQNKNEIANYQNDLSFHDWLQQQADQKFHHWQLVMGLGIGIPSFTALVVGITWYSCHYYSKYCASGWRRRLRPIVFMETKKKRQY